VNGKRERKFSSARLTEQDVLAALEGRRRELEGGIEAAPDWSWPTWPASISNDMAAFALCLPPTRISVQAVIDPSQSLAPSSPDLSRARRAASNE